MLRGTEYTVLTISNSCRHELPEAATDLRALPGDALIIWTDSLTDPAAAASPQCVIWRDVKAIDTRRVPVRITIHSELTRKRLGVAVVIPLPKVADTQGIAEHQASRTAAIA